MPPVAKMWMPTLVARRAVAETVVAPISPVDKTYAMSRRLTLLTYVAMRHRVRGRLTLFAGEGEWGERLRQYGPWGYERKRRILRG